MKLCTIALDDSDETRALDDWIERSGITRADFKSADVVWYRACTRELPPVEPPGHACGVLCTGSAARLPAAWGWEPNSPVDLTLGTKNGELGHQGFGKHPVFDGLPGGVLTWAPTDAEAGTSTVHQAPDWPAHARVIAVARDNASLTPERATIWELTAPAGGIVLAVGAFVTQPAHSPALQANLERLLLNALRYAARGRPAHGGHWPRVQRSAAEPSPALQPARLPALREDIAHSMSSPVLGVTADEPIALIGRRAHGSGNARQGIHDVWASGLRIVHALELPDFGAQHGVLHPELLHRCTVERVFVPLELPAIVWNWTAQEPLSLALRWKVDLRMAAPLPSGLLGSLRWNTGDRWLLVERAETGDAALFCFDREVQWRTTTPRPTLADPEIQSDDAGALQVEASVSLGAGESCTLAALATGAGTQSQDALTRALDQPAGLLRSRVAHGSRIDRERVSIETPSQGANQGWRHALHQLDALITETSGFGRAPIDTSTVHTESPAHITSSAIAVALAAAAAGDHGCARALLQFLAAAQDAGGRIADRVTTSGFASYNGESATQQYLQLFIGWFGWSGDVVFARSCWPSVRSALAACANHELSQGTMTRLREIADAIGEAAGAGPLLRSSVTADAGRVLRSPESAAWTELEPARAEQAWSSWLERVATSQTLPSVHAAGVISEYLDGLLGLEPDAVRHRVRLRPRVPADWPEFRVSNLALGDFRFALDYHRSESKHTFVLCPLAGMVPVRVVFEPSLAVPGIGRIAVDGRPASLDQRRQAGRWVVPLQVVLDHERTVVIEEVAG